MSPIYPLDYRISRWMSRTRCTCGTPPRIQPNMLYRLLGHSGLRVSEICLGTMTFGTEWPLGADYETSKAVFDAFVNAGGNFLDTANRYTEGTSENGSASSSPPTATTSSSPPSTPSTTGPATPTSQATTART